MVRSVAMNIPIVLNITLNLIAFHMKLITGQSFIKEHFHLYVH
jgi:hypothetical protein